MNIIRKTVIIHAPVHPVFEYVLNPDHLPEMCPNLLAVQEVQRLPNGGRSFEWEYRMAGTHFWGSCRTTECDVNHCLVSQIEGGITGRATWFFRPENQGTHVALVVEYVVPPPLIHKPHQEALIQENETAVAALLERLKINIEESQTPAAPKKAYLV